MASWKSPLASFVPKLTFEFECFFPSKSFYLLYTNIPCEFYIFYVNLLRLVKLLLMLPQADINLYLSFYLFLQILRTHYILCMGCYINFAYFQRFKALFQPDPKWVYPSDQNDRSSVKLKVSAQFRQHRKNLNKFCNFWNYDPIFYSSAYFGYTMFV